MPIKMHRSLAMHPGEWLREELVMARGIPNERLAELLDLLEEEVLALLAGRVAMTPDLAERWHHAFGVSASLLTNMQRNYDQANPALGSRPG